ncbi:MAG: glycosyltransferase family 39 protein [Acidobacteria bacterium]|nr:glycosyltransferase family 39 protein [Acidobacteriota bacterium]
MTNRRLLLVLLLVAAVIPYFVNLGTTSIIDANEAFYSETPREMLESGDYVNSSFNYEPRFNKPPLSYWVVAGFYHAMGISLTAARLPIAIGALVILGTVFLLGRQAFSTDAGLWAALTLAATPRMLLFSRRIIIDVYTAMFVGLTLLCFVLAETQPARRRRWLVAMYVAVGLGVMTKGPVAAVLPALVLGVYLAVTGRLHLVTRMMLPAGVLIVAAIVVPYYAALYAQHGWQYISTFIVDENLARYAEGVGAPNRGPLFYLPVVFTDLYFPWSLLLPFSFALVPWRDILAGSGWRRVWGADEAGPPAVTGRLRLLFGLWIALIVGFFSLSKAQQDLYVLPFVAAGAPLVGGLVAQWLSGTGSAALQRATRWGVGAMATVLAILGALVAWFVGGSGEPIHVAGAWPAGMLVLAGGLAALAWTIRHSRWKAVVTLAAAVIVAHWILVIWALPDFERYKPVPRLAQAIQQQAPAGSPVGTFRIATPSLVFYLRQHVTEMFDVNQLRDYLRANPRAYCVMRGEDYQDTSASLGIPTRIVAHAPHFDAQLDDVLNRTPLPDLILITPANGVGQE